MKYMNMNVLRISAIFPAGAALLWGCTVESADTDTDYLSDLNYYSTVLKNVVLDDAVYGGMEAMLQLDTYIGLSEEERNSEKWQEYAGSISVSGNEVTSTAYVVNVKDGIPLMQEGAEWQLSVRKYSYYIDYYYSVSGGCQYNMLSMTVKCVGDSTWIFAGSSDAAGQLYNLQFSGKCSLGYVDVPGIVNTKARVWTIDDMKGTTFEDSGYSSKFNAGYEYTVPINGMKSESGVFSVDFFKDGILIGNTTEKQ